MKRLLIYFIFSLTILNAGLIDAIAVIVNNKAITLSDIDNEMNAFHIDKQTAVNKLVDKILYEQSLRKYNITVDIFDIDNYIDKLAERNKMTTFEFKNAIKQQQNYEVFKEQIKNQLKHQKLISKIAANKIKRASVQDLQIYYNNHKEEFKIANKIDVILYSSKDKNKLEELKKNPMLALDNVEVKNLTFTQKNSSSQVKYILKNTKEKTFSAIFVENKQYNMMFVSDKQDIQTIPFKDVKNQIFNIIMQKREQDYLKSYFETIKLTAKIKVLR